MSYDIDLIDPKTREVLEYDKRHFMRGGTYAVGGTREMTLNITYNYAEHYYRIFGDEGIRTIYGMTGRESIPILKNAISQLGDDVSDDYWEETEGNAKVALTYLLQFAEDAPEGVWSGD